MTAPSVRWAMVAGAAGGLVALSLLAGLAYSARQSTFDAYVALHEVRRVLWPASILLVGTAGREMTSGGLVILATSIAGNVLLYGLIGGLASTLRRPVSRPLGMSR